MTRAIIVSSLLFSFTCSHKLTQSHKVIDTKRHGTPIMRALQALPLSGRITLADDTGHQKMSQFLTCNRLDQALTREVVV